MKKKISYTISALFGLLLTANVQAETKPIRALYLTGGCCHDYNKQKVILPEGISTRANVTWTIDQGPGGGKHVFKVLQKEGWEKNFDVVFYNICFAHETNAAYIESIVNAHKKSGIGAIGTHCTYHSYHWKAETDAWEELLGITSPRHGKKGAITVTSLESDHPIMKGFPATWVTPMGELYHIDKTWPTATPLAKGTIDGGKKFHECIWVNEIGKAKYFGTTLGHHNETMETKEYLDLVARGVLWVTGHLKADGTPEAGYEGKK